MDSSDGSFDGSRIGIGLNSRKSQDSGDGEGEKLRKSEHRGERRESRWTLGVNLFNPHGGFI